jgi:hypothetical protein
MSRLLLPPPVTPAPPAILADSRPDVSCTVTDSGSPTVLPVSVTLTPVIEAIWVTPMTFEAGARIDGRPLTVTVVDFAPAVLPNPSVAFTVMVSVASDESVSCKLANVAFTSVNVPLTLRPTVPDPVTIASPDAVAASRPLVSASVTVKFSPAVAPVSETLTPEMALDLATPTVAVPGAASTGPLAAATVMLCAAAALPRLSVAFSVIVSDGVVPSVSLRVPRAKFTCVSEPLIVSVVPGPDTLAPPPVLADSTPLVSFTVTENVSFVVVPLSDRLTPETGAALPTPTLSVDGAAITGNPLTVTPTAPAIAVLPNPSVAFSVIEAAPVVASVSSKVASALCTDEKTPLIVSEVLLLPPGVTPDELPTVSSPWLSDTVTEADSPVVLPFSDKPMPLIVVCLLTPITTEPGAVNTGRALTVTAIVCCAAVLRN